MPQMAPIMWLPLFILIITLLLLTKSTIYFISSKNSTKAKSQKNYFNSSWLW
uniref:ATP synthase complex subunit 8 n=1 Tax=Eulimnogammarus cyaneus TaxID=52945 RepID=A0A1L5BW28_9CRUS|nr:ATP synthase F0 subunit 8 [Eulimnogammarus cyaneus]APL97172.1 ATP synthase F0 subunit 8 [Eulimnogammarus cyaneus]